MIDNLSDLIPSFDSHGVDLSLNRMKKALHEIENPCRNTPAIQIVGTNGKGSIASFIDSTLQTNGINAGVTTSPHLISWCERIRTKGHLITFKELRERLEKLLSD